jgi:hypothetical protein
MKIFSTNQYEKYKLQILPQIMDKKSTLSKCKNPNHKGNLLKKRKHKDMLAI